MHVGLFMVDWITIAKLSELLRRDLGETTKLSPPGYLFVLCINQLHNGNYIINRDFLIVIFIEITFLL